MPRRLLLAPLAALAVAGCSTAAGLEEHPGVTAPTSAPTRPVPPAPPDEAFATATAEPEQPQARREPSHVQLHVEPVAPRPVVALTFDDGPGPFTSQVLEALLEADAVATFFVVGDNLPGREDTITDLVEAGMSVQWHTRTHPDLTRLGDAAVVTELTVPKALRAAGANPSCVRPPYGATDRRVHDLIAAAGLRQQLWTVDPRDWAATDPDAVVETVMARVKDESVVLLHDGGGNRSVTVQALPALLQALADEGYRTVRLCEENPS